MQLWARPYLPPSVISKEDHPKLSLYSSYAGRAVDISEDEVSMYVCGITPYDATHLGHAATYLTYDLVNRFLIASGRKVNYAQNVTDIDDPLLERANRDKTNWEDLADSQIELFKDDMAALRVNPPTFYESVTENMDLIIAAIEKISEKGFVYEVDGDMYLNLRAIPGAIENLPFNENEALQIFRERGGDPDRKGKKHPLDNLLWQKAREAEPSWSSPFGYGRPGWHVECVAIALGFLKVGDNFCITLQGGGNDLFFPHHYMSNYQTFALSGKPLAKIFSHAGMIGYAGEKMSKSKGNLVFVSKLLAAGTDPIALRAALLNRNYREYFSWEDAEIVKATRLLDKLRSSLSREEVAPTEEVIEELVGFLSNDLDTVSAFRTLTNWCERTENGETGGNAGRLARTIDLYLGLAL
jgi:L-cysteine:1D-myo-inositol 2-amino-2-deoxy-alpha-D-glucopyranoside ligase